MAGGALLPHAAHGGDNVVSHLGDGVEYKVEMQSDFSDGLTPLWLNANRHGLSSLARTNGYVRGSVTRPLSADSVRNWGVGYCVDMVLPYNYTSVFVVQQAYAEVRWLHGVLTVGSKEYPMELKNNRLSSGSQTLGINARPVPQVRLAIPEYYTFPFGKGWIHIKGHIAYGCMTDDNWQHRFTGRKSKYADNVLYHSKAGYLKIGNAGKGFPLSVELGLEMAATFGGTAYVPDGSGNLIPMKSDNGVGAFWNAFVPGGHDAGETTYQNIEGNQLGSWVARVNWDTDKLRVSIYADKYFEDHSAMFQMDYDGYGQGSGWQIKKDNRYLLYDFTDIMLGAEFEWKKDWWVNGVVFEYINTKYQSGPLYHDHTSAVPDHIGGKDNYYNHSIFTGWQHWGQVIGNPLYRSPIYNEDGRIMVKDNRFVAYHAGIGGHPLPRFSYRVLASWQEGLGTYDEPYDSKQHNVSLMVEGEYKFSGRLLGGWSVRGALGMDFGRLLGDNKGFQITLTKRGLLNR